MDALSKLYARLKLVPKKPQPQVVRAPALTGQRAAEQRRSQPHRPRPPVQKVMRPGVAAPAVKLAPPSPVKLKVAVDPHEHAMSLPPQSFLAKCDGCGKDKGNDEQRFCGRGVQRKRISGGANAPRVVPPPASNERATLAEVTAEPQRLFLKECTTVDADSGSKCKLLAPHTGYPCRNERGVIRQGLLPGEVSRREAALLEAAFTNPSENENKRASGTDRHMADRRASAVRKAGAK